MKISTTRFGDMEIDDARIITFDEGILGFQQYRKYTLIDHEKNSPFTWLQSIEKPDLAFVLIDPLTVFPDYRAEVMKQDIDDIKLNSLEKAVVVCIVTIAKGCASVTANLVGPIVINPDTMLAKQVVLTNSQYGLRHSIVGPVKKEGQGT